MYVIRVSIGCKGGTKHYERKRDKSLKSVRNDEPKEMKRIFSKYFKIFFLWILLIG